MQLKNNFRILLLLSFFVGLSAYASECRDLLSLNINAQTETEHYQENNERVFSSYTVVLGERFDDLFIAPKKPIKWLDVGVGYGLAPLQKVLSGEVSQATLINSQDNWGFLFSLDSAPTDYHLRSRIAAFAYKLKLPIPPESIFETPKPETQKDWLEHIASIKAVVDYAKEGNRYRYLVGFAEDVLPSVEGDQTILTDVFGAYLYSADRITLLELYYEKLARDGNGFVVVKSTPDAAAEYGAVNRVENSILSFEQHLIRLFPKIFTIERVRSGEQWVMALHMKRDPQFKALDLKQHFEIIEAHLDSEAGQIMSQVPQVTMKLKTPLK